MKKNKPIPSIKKSPFFGSTMLVFGQLWILFILVPYFYLILYNIWKNYFQLNVYWIYFVIPMGAILAVLRLIIKPPNPFGEGWLQPRSMTMLTEEERKALTFLKTSKKLKKLIIITGLLLFAIILLFPLLKISIKISTQNYIQQKIDLISILGVSFIYGFSSYILLIFISFRYLINHWNEIQQMNIEPWPKDKPYSTGPFRYRVPEEGSFIGDILSIDPNTPFNWHDFVIILSVFLSIGLIFWGVGVAAILFSKIPMFNLSLKLISLITGIAILNISAKMWYKKHKKK